MNENVARHPVDPELADLLDRLREDHCPICTWPLKPEGKVTSIATCTKTRFRSRCLPRLLGRAA